MIRGMRILVGVAAVLAWVGPASGQGLVYHGRLNDGTGRGRVEHRGWLYDVAEGDEIPGVGTVAALTDDTAVVRRALSDTDRRDRAAQGRVPADVEEIRIVNPSGRLMPR